jgi:hypothetical protein
MTIMGKNYTKDEKRPRSNKIHGKYDLEAIL